MVLTISLMSFESCSYINNAKKTAFKEFSPEAILRKYEWFKDASAMLNKKKQDIQVYEANIQSMVDEYEGVARKDWDRIDKEQFNQWRIELVGIKASYNQLAAEYNSQSSKWNWQYFEGQPPLEKEFSQYIDN